jgi:hypothetical protein
MKMKHLFAIMMVAVLFTACSPVCEDSNVIVDTLAVDTICNDSLHIDTINREIIKINTTKAD